MIQADRSASAYAPAAVQPMCGCTDLGHDDVRRLIVAKALKSIPAVMQALEWKTSCGCAKCRPALNYYLLAAWPGEYEDDGQSRFINERVHANIQKDGTYSVVPRMWGGVTSAAELRAIADVVDKFAHSDGEGHRRPADRPARRHARSSCRPSGPTSTPRASSPAHAYGKALRTVKTCVGSDWCRFGTQDSTGLGIKLEKFLWGSWTPAKVKMAVSGCPRNCAEATCKDVGVICVDSGYDIVFAGAAGLDIKGTRGALPCRDRGGDDRDHRRPRPALSRAGRAISSASTNGRSGSASSSIKAQVVEDVGEAARALRPLRLLAAASRRTIRGRERVAGKDAHEFAPHRRPRSRPSRSKTA